MTKVSSTNLLASGNDDYFSSGRVVTDNFDDSVSGDVAEVFIRERRSFQRHTTWKTTKQI